MVETTQHRNGPEQGSETIPAWITVPNLFDQALNGLAMTSWPTRVGVILEPIDNGSPRLGLIPFDPTLQGSSVHAKLPGNGTNRPTFMQPEQGLCTPNVVGIAPMMSQVMQALSCPRCQMERCH